MAVPTPLRVFVCDDSAGFTAMLSGWAKHVDGVELAGTAASGEQLLATLTDARADVVLLDLILPEGPASPELVDRVRDLVPGVRVVLLSSMPEDRLEQEAARVGADAHCTKLTTVDELLGVVTGAA